MCGRYTIRRIDLFIRKGAMEQPVFDTFDEKHFVPRFNVAPSQDLPVVRLNASGKPSLGLARWGLIPSWAKGKPKFQPINARSETAATSGMFRQALERRRCLVPADGFYEWQKQPDGAKRPMFIHLKDDDPFAFAGLWERWKPEEGVEPLDTFTVLTTSPNELMRSIHDRMPVILKPDDYAKWLDRETAKETVMELLKPFEKVEAMEAREVSKRVNSPKNDDATLIEAA